MRAVVMLVLVVVLPAVAAGATPQRDALEHAIDVLDGAPTTSATDDAALWDTGGGVAMPSGGGQTLGVSSR